MLAPIRPPFTGGFSTMGNTAGNTGLVTGRMVMVGTNNITLSGSTDLSGNLTVSVSGGAAGGFSAGVSNVGNTAGSTGVSGTRLVLVGSQNISLSQSTDANGATVSFSGGAGAAGNTGFISANATASLGTVNFSNSNNFTFGIAGQTLTASFAMLSAGLSTGGNTQGNTTVNTGSRLVFVGTNNITLSQATAAGATTISISGNAAQTTQPAINALGISNTGNTAGNTGTSSGITWVVAGSNGITASQSTAGGGPNTIWISGATQTVQTQGITGDQLSIGVSTGGNTSGNTTVNSGSRMVFVGSNGITLSQGTAAGATTLTISGITQSVQTQGITGDQLSVGVSTGGNTAGNTTVNSGSRLVFAAAGNATVSQVTAAGATTLQFSAGTQTNQSAIKAFGASNTGNTAGNTGVSTGVDWVVAGTNNITVSESTAGGGPNTLWISGAAGGAALSVGVSTGGNTSGDTGVFTGRMVLVGSNNITLSGSSNAGSYTVTISGPNAQSAGMSTAGNTSGNTGFVTGQFALAGGNNITLSGSTNAGSMTITVSGPAMMVAGMSTNGNTSGNTGLVSNQLCLIGGNNITLSGSTNAGSMSLTISAPNLGAGAFSGGVSTGGNTAGNTGITGTQLVFVGSNMVSLSQTTGANGGTITINATQTNQSAIKGLGVSNTGNTAGNTGISTGIDFIVAGSGAITASQSTAAGNNTIWLSVPQTSSLSATGWVQISTNGSTISIGATTTANLYAVGNTFGTSSGTADIRTVSISAGSGLQVAASNSGWVIGQKPAGFYEGFPGELKTAVPMVSGSTSQVMQFCLPYALTAQFVRFPIALTTNSTTLSTLGSSMNGSATVATTWNAVIYKPGDGASSRSLISVAKASATWGMLNSISVAANGTVYSITQSLVGAVEGAAFTSSTQFSITNTNYSFTTNQIFTNFSGSRFLDLNMTDSLSAGGYWMIAGWSTSSASNSARISAATNCNLGYSVNYGDTVSNIAWGIMGSTNLSSGNMVGAGSFSTAGGGTTSILPISAITSTASHFRPYFQIAGSA